MNHVLVSLDEVQSGRLSLNDVRARHILEILKIQSGQCFRMGVINHSTGSAELVDTDTQWLYFRYHLENNAEKLLPLTLLMGATRPPVLRRILRDAAAFGVQRFLITHTKNSEKSYLQSSIWQNDQYKNAVYEGLSLARCVTMPEIIRCFNLEEALQHVNSACRILADADAEKKLSHLPCSLPLTLAIGPERGFTVQEIEYLQQEGFISGHFGKRILRSETACFTALSIVCYTAELF